MRKRAKSAKRSVRRGSPKRTARLKRQKRRLQRKPKLFKFNKLEQNQVPEKSTRNVPISSNGRQAAQNGLPTCYGDDQITLLVRDPWWLYAYWEVTPRREEEVLKAIRRAGLVRQKTVLRVYDTTGAAPENANSFFDIELNFFADHWYIDVGNPDREWVVDVGIRTTNGRFFTLVRSRQVRTPRFGPSDILDEEWMLPEEISLKLFGLSGIGGRGAASLDFKKLWGLWGRSSESARKTSIQ